MAHRQSIVYRTGRHVTRLLVRELPADRVFHNIHHTINVVQGVADIGRAEGLTEEQLEILILAAWFHDAGHLKTYAGHEEVSETLATEWLRSQHYPKDKIREVARCIRVTTMPQQPLDTMERVICDADLYHLTFPSYDHYQDILREEWKNVLGLEMTDEEWEASNESFLLSHHYWTEYGQSVLEPRKWEVTHRSNDIGLDEHDLNNHLGPTLR